MCVGSETLNFVNVRLDSPRQPITKSLDTEKVGLLYLSRSSSIVEYSDDENSSSASFISGALVFAGGGFGASRWKLSGSLRSADCFGTPGEVSQLKGMLIENDAEE